MNKIICLDVFEHGVCPVKWISWNICCYCQSSAQFMLVLDVISQISFFLALSYILTSSMYISCYLDFKTHLLHTYFQDLSYRRWLPMSIQQIMMSLALGSLSFAVMQK